MKALFSLRAVGPVLIASIYLSACSETGESLNFLRSAQLVDEGATDGDCVAMVQGGEVTRTLLAGQYIDAGTVSVKVENDQLIVTYQTGNGWYLLEAYLWVDDVPPPAQNPAPGQFPYKSGDIYGATTYTFIVPLDNEFFTFACPSPDLTIYLAAHAALKKVNNNEPGGYQFETGWADGAPIVETGNWATYFDVTLACDCEEDTDTDVVTEVCETAYGFGGDNAACFIDLPHGFSNWGWTNGPLSEGSYTFDLYAGAGQCDLSKGVHAGYVDVEYDDGTVTVTYALFDDYYTSETHLYIGTDMVPMTKKGKFTVAPGQYPYAGGLEFSVDIAPDEDLFVIAHAVVCTEIQGIPR